MILKFKIGRSKVADAPRPINISENPRTKKIERISIGRWLLMLSDTRISSNDDPVRKHRYEGTIGKTHGDKKLNSPAKKQTIKNKSIAINIHYSFTYQIKYGIKKWTIRKKYL